VTLPLLKQPFFAGIVYAFVRSITAISSIIFLVSPRWSLATTSVFSLFESSRYGDASAYILLMILIILVAIVVIDSLIQFLLNPRSRKQKAAKERVVSNGSIS
jgi:iron(III) transport system permease protein